MSNMALAQPDCWSSSTFVYIPYVFSLVQLHDCPEQYQLVFLTMTVNIAYSDISASVDCEISKNFKTFRQASLRKVRCLGFKFLIYKHI